MPSKEEIIADTLPVLPILIPLGIHFLLVSFVLLFAGGFQGAVWLPQTYYFSHLVLMLVGLWACHDKKSIISAISVPVVIIFTILLDIIQLGINFSAFNNVGSLWQFSAAMAIFNLLFKPLSAALCCFAVYVRAGGHLPGILGGGGGGGGGDSYGTLHGSSEEQ